MFQLKVVISDEIDELFELPALYRTAREALELMMDRRFHSGNVCTVAQLRTPLLLKELEGRSDLIAKEKKTCDALFTHRNTVLYRIRRIEDDFAIPLDEPAAHADLLVGVSLLLFKEKGPDFFLHTVTKNEREEQ